MKFVSEDFTAGRYSELIGYITNRYTITGYHGQHNDENIIILRHDVDMSPHQARVLARIEYDHGVASTFFFQLSSRFYNIFEPVTRDILRSIINMGHNIGIHFDPELYDENTENLTECVEREARILSEIVETDVNCCTLHNPTTTDTRLFDGRKVGRLLNSSSPFFREHYTYCSDSNGFWRFRSLQEIISDPEVIRLCALIHPEWWTETSMSPREKVMYWIDDRARNCTVSYDKLLSKHNRPNS